MTTLAEPAKIGAYQLAISSMDKPSPAYSGDEPFIFVSYAHADEDEVLPKVNWLQSQDLHVWWDEGISGGSRWRDEIASRISQCHVLLFYVSPQSVQSSVCREELEYALAHDRPILLVHLSDTELPQGLKLASSNRQALFRHALAQPEYERKLLAAMTSLLGQVTREPQFETKRPPPSNRLTRRLTVTLTTVFALCLVAAVSITWWLSTTEAPVSNPTARFQQLLPTGFGGVGS